MQNMDPVDKYGNTEITHKAENTAVYAARCSKLFIICVVLLFWAADCDICLHTVGKRRLTCMNSHYICFVRRRSDVRPAPEGQDAGWFIEWCKWQCLQEVIPTDQSPRPLTPNPQRLEEGLVYWIRGRRTSRGPSISNTSLSWDGSQREEVQVARKGWKKEK